MPIVIPVRMHFNAQDLWFNPRQTGACKGDHVVVTTERGTEFGLATADPFEVPKSELKAELKPILRVATENDLALAEELARKGEEAMPTFRSLIKKHGLEMKPVGVEFLFGGEKAVFYFAAEDRIDFRELVRDLAATFHQRVDMRQIGVRDEARLIGGFAPCGQELCCVRMGGEFEPVSIRMAKEQDLPLNSSKISGVCGRLMCCLRYEFEAYRDFKQRAPKKNALIDTPLGKAKIVEYNTPRETLTLRLENGKSFTVALKDMTCSESCAKRAVEPGRLARPDTVTREVLEQIGTPEIMLQLAELDRANDPDGYALDDSLLTTERRTPRRRSGSPATGGTAKEASEGREATKRTPRRKAGQTGGETGQPQRTEAKAPRTRQGKATAEQQDHPQQTRPRGGGMRPRRSNAKARQAQAAEGQAAVRRQQDPSTQQEEPQERKRHARRHHSAAADAAPAPAERQAQPTPRRREPQGASEDKALRSRGRQGSGRPGAERQETTSPANRRTRQRRPQQQAAGGTERPTPRGSEGANAPEQQSPRRRRRPGDKGGTRADGQGGEE